MPELVFSFVTLSVLLIVGFALFLRHRNQQMAHQERLAALEKGVPIPAGPTSAPWSPRVYLLRGLVWTFVGAALTIALLGAALMTEGRYYEPAEWQARRAREISHDLEIPIDQARAIVSREVAQRTEAHNAPVAIALFGLIPLGVGLAYLVFYRSERATNSPA